MFSGPNGTGKGDKPRIGIPSEEWAKRWDKIFGNKNKQKGNKSGKRSK
tara:strand:+ start:601 stop:744 length:144 start_codon:yes stop_codon:yes gene_type:complete